MGMFDTIYGKVTCPYCNKKHEFEDQTKAYGCTLVWYTFGDYIEKGNINGSVKLQSYCDKSDELFDVNMILKRGQIIKFVNNQELEDIDIDKFENIEEGLGHKIEYENSCIKGVGRAKEEVNFKDHPKNIGDKIIALKNEWIIKEIYKEVLQKQEDENLNSIFKMAYCNSFIYKVKGKLGNRIIRVNDRSNYIIDDFMEVFYKTDNYEDYDSNNPHNFYIQLGCKLVKYKRE